MNFNFVPVGNFYSGLYYEYDEKTEEYGNPRKMKFKPHGDTPIREFRNQPLSGALGSKYGASIKVYDNYPFKPKDKVELPDFGVSAEITAVDPAIGVTTALVNVFVRGGSGYTPKVLHLNKDDL